jgi:hypothetical protein
LVAKLNSRIENRQGSTGGRGPLGELVADGEEKATRNTLLEADVLAGVLLHRFCEELTV